MKEGPGRLIRFAGSLALELNFINHDSTTPKSTSFPKGRLWRKKEGTF